MSRAAVVLATIGLLIPTGGRTFAAPSTDAAPRVIDVALSEGGVLEGQLLSADGLPLAGAEATLSASGKEVAKTVADDAGRFRISGLKGGVYSLTAGTTTSIYRLWAPATSPPQAADGALLVTGSNVERGNLPRGSGPGAVLMIAVIAAIVVVAIADRDRAPGS